jgi:transglutaminase-like putative cysteine protease
MRDYGERHRGAKTMPKWYHTMIADPASNCLSRTFFIDCDHKAVREKARELIAGSKGMKERAVRLFSFVRDEIRYNIYAERLTDADFKASRVLARKEGYCVQKAVLLVALARAAGIPARLRFAEIRSHLTAPDIVAKRGSDIFPYHGFTDLCVDGRWVKATPRTISHTAREWALYPSALTGKRM